MGLIFLRNRVSGALPTPAASGGTETVIDVSGTYYRVHTFLTSGTLTVNSSIATAEYLVVAGGGGAGRGRGGGGAGGMLTGSGLAISAGSEAITVGAGGLGDVGFPNNGENSVAFGLTAIGGGSGVGEVQQAQSGGSGGGGGTVGGSGTPGQGHDGGKNDPANANARGGGGGAGEAGFDAVGNVGGAGGDGLPSSITGEEVYYAGGGGSGCRYTVCALGGLGGGGDGRGLGGSPAGSHGEDGKGGGAGGGNYLNGGSGIVVVRYEITEAEYLEEV
jgi:hypothetical protein